MTSCRFLVERSSSLEKGFNVGGSTVQFRFVLAFRFCVCGFSQHHPIMKNSTQ
jgi:hypothetical protein